MRAELRYGLISSHSTQRTPYVLGAFSTQAQLAVCHYAVAQEV